MFRKNPLVDLGGGIDSNLKHHRTDISLFFYPPRPGTLPPFWNILLWVALGVFSILLPVLPKPQGILFLLVSLILRSIYSLGLGPALLLLGTVNVSAGSF